METKKFTIVDTRTNKVTVIESIATTVGELKADLRANNIVPDGMAIQEGLTKTEFGDNDNTLLPHDVPYRGSTTNNLVFRITKKNKNIESGMTRSEAYSKIKDLDLAEAIKDKYGKNYTIVKTEDLIAEVEKAEGEALSYFEDDTEEDTCCAQTNAVVSTLKQLIAELFDQDILDYGKMKALLKMLEPATKSDDELYSSSELSDMFSDM